MARFRIRSGLRADAFDDLAIERQFHVRPPGRGVADMDVGDRGAGLGRLEAGLSDLGGRDRQMRRLLVKPEVELFDCGDIALLHDLIANGALDPAPLCSFVMGVRYGFQPSPETVLLRQAFAHEFSAEFAALQIVGADEGNVLVRPGAVYEDDLDAGRLCPIDNGPERRRVRRRQRDAVHLLGDQIFDLADLSLNVGLARGATTMTLTPISLPLAPRLPRTPPSKDCPPPDLSC